MDLKEILIEEGIVKIRTKDEKPFILKSGKESRLFIDIKKAALNPDILDKIASEIYYMGMDEILNLYDFDLIASVAVGGIPIATALSLTTGIPQIIVRSEKHDRGTQTQIIGDDGNDNLRGKKCVLIEDVATTGGSIINAVTALDKVGAICNNVIVVVDREEGAQELCKKNKLNLYPILKKSDFGIKEES